VGSRACNVGTGTVDIEVLAIKRKLASFDYTNSTIAECPAECFQYRWQLLIFNS
jgi:hypothetical protein